MIWIMDRGDRVYLEEIKNIKVIAFLNFGEPHLTDRHMYKEKSPIASK